MTHERGLPASVVLADGQPRTLRYSLRALKQLKVDHGIDMLRGTTLGAVMDDPEKLAILLSAGLTAASPDCTPDWVMDNVEASMLMTIAPELVYAATGQRIDLKAPAVTGNGAGPEVSHPTGSTSGPLAATTSGSVNESSGT